MNFIFAGTPAFAAQVLTHLVELGRQPCLVVSQPSRPRGRGRHPGSPAVVQAAGRLSLRCLQVEDINSPEVRAELAAAGASTLISAAFGQLFRAPLLEGFLCLNVHASLLPAYRGAAPVERAIAAGEAFTGVTIMKMAPGLDEGPWALQTSLSIGLRDDAGSVGRALALLGANGIDQVLTGLDDGNITWAQQEGPSSYAAKLTAADTLLDLNRSALQVHAQVRSLSPELGARTLLGDLELKIWRTWPVQVPGFGPLPSEVESVANQPRRLAVSDSRLFVGCAQGAVEILALQPAGKERMSASAFLRGYGRRLRDPLQTPALTNWSPRSA